MKRMNTISLALPRALNSRPRIISWALKYPKEYVYDDARIKETLLTAYVRGDGNSEIGYLTISELEEASIWKSKHRNVTRVRKNGESSVRARSHMAFETGDYRHLSFAPPKGLKGVALRTAVAIMHFVFSTRYPVIDENALRALGQPDVKNYNHDLWIRYQELCLSWASRYEVDLRTLDRALWTYGDWLKQRERKRSS